MLATKSLHTVAHGARKKRSCLGTVAIVIVTAIVTMAVSPYVRQTWQEAVWPRIMQWELFPVSLRNMVTTARPNSPADNIASSGEIDAFGATQNEIRNNLGKLYQLPGEVRLIRESEELDKKIALTLDGMLDSEIMLRILDLFERYDAKATFFISGMQASAEPEIVKAIAEAGHRVGNYTMRGREHMEKLSQEELVEDLSVANTVFAGLLGEKATWLKANATQYTPEFLQAADACGFSGVVQNTSILTYHSFRSFEAVQSYVDKLPYRSILSIKLSGVLDASEYTPKETLEQPAIDLQADAATQIDSKASLDKDERLLQMLDWLLQALAHTNFAPETVEYRQLNAGALAQAQSGLNTVEAAVGYAFSGLGRPDELMSVLNTLRMIHGVGTFFVSNQEIEAYPERIAMLIDQGQALGIAYYPKGDDDYYTVAYELFHARQLLAQYGREDVNLVFQPWGDHGDALKEAVSALGMGLIHYDIALARSDNQSAQSTQEVIDSVYRENTYGFRRGSTVFFRMDYFERSSLVCELLLSLEGTRNAYPIRAIQDLWENRESRFTYPLPMEAILPEVRDRIHVGQMTTDFVSYATARYLGNKDINTSSQLPGFDSAQIKALDKVGRVKTEDNVVFLTFDDWGSDVNLSKLLEVLARHNAKATFFIRTEFVPDNPNLLRAIALAGHEIASHSHTHMPLAHDPDGRWRFTTLTPEEIVALQQDLIASYRVLQSIVGDIQLDNGRPALSRLFRPPTMAVSREGMWAAFDCGFSYIVNGSYTSHDYEAQSAARLARDIRGNVRAGSIVIMHMSDNSIYTAEALDLYLTELEAETAGVPYHFARLSDYLTD